MGIRLKVISLLPMLMLLQSCDGTPFGQQLSESFNPQAGASNPALTEPAPVDNVSAATVNAESNEQQDRVNDQAESKANDDKDFTEPERVKQSSPEVGTNSSAGKPAPERTLPYRIMIRLSAADPAAPAEGVTEALRRAGIGFEVETIEKVPDSELIQPATVQPTPAS